MSQVTDLSHDRLVRTMIESALAGTKKGATDIDGKVAEMKRAIEECDDETIEKITKSRAKNFEEWLTSLVRLGGAVKDVAQLFRGLRLK